MAKTAADHARDYAQMRKKDAEAEKAWKEKQQREKYGTSYLPSKDFGWTPKPTAPTFPGVMPPSGGGSNSQKTSSNSGNKGGGSSDRTPSKTTTTTPSVPGVTTTQPEADDDYLDRMLERALRQQEEARAEQLRASINQGVNTLESQKPELEKQYQKGAQQAYVEKMLAQRDLPQVMAAQGLTGGVHESSLIDLDNTYGNNVNALQDSYNSALNDIDRDVANIKATGNISLAENANTHAQKLFEAIQQAKIANQQAQSKYIASGGGTSTGAGENDPAAALKTLLKNPFVARAETRYDPDSQPEKFLDYVSQFVDNAELQQLIAYYGIPKEAVDRWVGAAPALSGPYGNMLADQKRFGVM